MPNPLTDELTPEAKAELSAIFAAMRQRYQPMRVRKIDVRAPKFWERRGW